MKLLGVETSCDETAIGIVEDGRRVLSSAFASSLKLHAPYGGVIPEIAARSHVETMWDVLEQALGEAKCSLQDLDAIAVTRGPGLPGALLVGLAFAKGLALALDRPLIPVDHLAAHLYAGEMSEPGIEAPYVGLVVSGGHTILCVVHPDWRYEVLGQTRDDAVGEAFDKVGKLLGLGYPGGPAIDRISEEARGARVVFPRAQSKQPFDFSFSGLKTAVYQHVQRLTERSGTELRAPRPPDAGVEPGPARLERDQLADIAASFQDAAVEVLVTKTVRACQRTGVRQVVVGGGVASNRRLRARFAEADGSQKLRVVFPPPELCVDNGAMVAGIGYPLLRSGRSASLALDSDPALALA